MDSGYFLVHLLFRNYYQLAGENFQELTLDTEFGHFFGKIWLELLFEFDSN